MENLRKAELATTRAENAEAERDALAATVERVRHLRSVSGDTIGVEELDAALDPKPAFVLPTEVPARIEAKRDVLGYIDTLTLWTNGARQFWRSEYNGEDWKPKGVMECFTDHRLLDGAE